MDTNKKEIMAILQDMFKIIGVMPKVDISEQNEGRLLVEMFGNDLGGLIGFRGETLNAIQLFLEIALFRKTGSWVPISVDIAGYRKDREDQLKRLVGKSCDRAKFFVKSVELSPMSSYDRMLVHTFVAQVPGVSSESVGEGRFRRVVISPKA
jgi:spoIIIJ-associated protein